MENTRESVNKWKMSKVNVWRKTTTTTKKKHIETERYM